jgi:hypothetical protein
MDEAALAEILRATQAARIEVDLPAAGRVSVPVLRRLETRAPADVPRAASCWAPNKPSLLFDGRAMWAELVLVGLLEAADWDARWVRNWSGGRQFCAGVGELKRLAGRGEEAFEAIHARAPELRGAGSWDVIAWNGDQVLFLESKQAHSRDQLRPDQLAFLDAALGLGIPVDAFAVVEYDAGARNEAGPATARRTPERRTSARSTPASPPRARTPRAVAALAALDPELIRLVETAADASAASRIDLRDPIAAYGAPAISAMEAWLEQGRSPGFAITVLEAVGRTADGPGAAAALRRIAAGLPDWADVAQQAIGRVPRAGRRTSTTRPGDPR